MKHSIITSVLGGIACALLMIGAWWYISHQNKNKAGFSRRLDTPRDHAVATSTYATSTYSVVYPSNFSVNDTYVYDQFGKKLIHGVKFLIPSEMATGTNLSAFDTGVSIEQLPRAQHCTADIYIPADVSAQQWNDAGVQYSVASTTEGAAGNHYEEEVYAFTESHPCTAVRYFIHSTAIENYPAGAVRAFDRAALIAAFDAIRRSVVFSPYMR